MNYCKDCKHFLELCIVGNGFSSICQNDQFSIVIDDPVFGPYLKFTPCSDIRKAGVECNYFEPKERLPA